MEDATRIALNEQAIAELKRQNELLFKLYQSSEEKLNTVLQCVTEIKKDGEYVRDNLNDHIKNSGANIKQIYANKDAAEMNGATIKNIEKNVSRQEKFSLVAVFAIVTAALKIAFFS